MVIEVVFDEDGLYFILFSCIGYFIKYAFELLLKIFNESVIVETVKLC